MRGILIFAVFIMISLSCFAQINTDQVMYNGQSRLYFGNYVNAIENFNMVIKSKPHLPEPYMYRGVSKLYLDDFRGAKEDLMKALSIKPYYPDAFLYLGVVNYNLREYQLAMENYSKAMELDGENADIYNNRGICKSAMKDIDGAIADYSKAIALKSKNYNAYLNRSIAYQVKKELDLAILDCDQLIRIKPNSALGYLSRGLIKIEKKNYAGALRDFDMSVYLEPNNAFAFQNRGLVKQQLEDYESAIMDYNMAIKYDPQMAGAYFNRAVAKEMAGKSDYQSDYNYAGLLNPEYQKKPWKTKEEQQQQQQQQILAFQQQQQQKLQKTTGQKGVITSDSISSSGNDSLQHQQEINLEELRQRKIKANLSISEKSDDSEKQSKEELKFQDKNIDIELLPIFHLNCLIREPARNNNVGYFNLSIEQLNKEFNYDPYMTISNILDVDQQAVTYFQNEILVFNGRIEQNKKIANNYLYRGVFKSILSLYNDAIADFDKAINTDERNVLAYFSRGNTRSLGVDAINRIQSESISLNNDHSTIGLATNNEVNIKDYDEILADYSVVIYMNPNLFFTYYNRGNIYCKMNKFYNAIEEYSLAIKIEPDFAEAYYNRGLVKVLLNDINGGASDLSKAGQLGISEAYNVIKRYCNN